MNFQTNYIKVLSKISNGTEIRRKVKFEDLQPISTQDATEMQLKMSKNKAVIEDGFTDIWFKSSKQYKLLTDWWNNQTLKQLFPQSFQIRLIPLNKKHPNVPGIEDFRPIFVLSSSIKWLELRFIGKLQKYIYEKIDKDQIGFFKGYQTGMNIIALINEIKKYKYQDRMAVLYVDLKPAYNTINRNLLFDIIRNKNILDINESNFLANLYNNFNYKMKNQKIYSLKGLPQGSILASILFNIYFDEVIQQTKQEFGKAHFTKAFTDDLAALIKQADLNKFITIIKKIFTQFDLIFNQYKSQIIKIRELVNENQYHESGLLYVNSYNYLGLKLDSFGSLKPHFTYLSQRINYPIRNIRFYSKNLSLKNQYLLWLVFIRSLQSYAFCVTLTQNTQIQLKFERLYSNSFQNFLSLPKNMPNKILDLILENAESSKSTIQKEFYQKFEKIFQEKLLSVPSFHNQQKFSLKIVKVLPNKILNLFYFQQYKCRYHDYILNFTNIMKHINQNMQQQFFKYLSQNNLKDTKIPLNQQNQKQKQIVNEISLQIQNIKNK